MRTRVYSQSARCFNLQLTRLPAMGQPQQEYKVQGCQKVVKKMRIPPFFAPFIARWLLAALKMQE